MIILNDHIASADRRIFQVNSWIHFYFFLPIAISSWTSISTLPPHFEDLVWKSDCLLLYLVLEISLWKDFLQCWRRAWNPYLLNLNLTLHKLHFMPLSSAWDACIPTVTPLISISVSQSKDTLPLYFLIFLFNFLWNSNYTSITLNI